MLAVLASTDGARGHERAAAEAVAGHAAQRWPGADWRVEAVGDPAGECAQLVASAGGRAGAGDLLLYSHLDTSLTGDPALDAAITGRSAPAPGHQVDLTARTVRGPGLGVARGPAAAVLVAFGRAATALDAAGKPFGLRLLLAARGTHRATWPGWDEAAALEGPTGVAEFLARHARPAAAVVAKGGPDGVLHDEPGACYLRIRVRAGWGAVMSRQQLAPAGGLLGHLGVLVDAVEAAGAALVAAAPTGDQAGAQFGIGAVRSGRPGKPDLSPGIVDLYCYLVLPGEIAPGGPARRFEDLLRTSLAGTPLAGVELSVLDQLVHAGGGTDPGEEVVRAAVAAYRDEHGIAPPAISGWTGSTDGVVLRSAGVPTVRLGPSRTVGVGDGSDVADLDELMACTRVYEQIAVRLGTP